MEKVEVIQIDVKLLEPSPFNPRKHLDEIKLKELADSIKNNGIRVPIIVRPAAKAHAYEIICGERRFKAAKLVGLSGIPGIVQKMTDKEVIECQVIENLQREDVHPLEEAEGYEALMKKHGYKTVDDIAAKIGKSRGYIYARLKLCDLIPENRKLFYEGKFSPSTALLVARIPAGLQKEAGIKVAKGEYNEKEPMSYREAQEYIHRHFMLHLNEAPFDPKDKDLCGKVGPCTICPKRTGNQKDLFPDVSSADVCTDPACFEAKKKAHVQKVISTAKAAGKKVLSPEECKEVFPYSGSSPQKGYIRLDSPCYEDSKNRSYKQLSAGLKDIEIAYAIHPERGEVVALITKATAAEIIKKAGVKVRLSDSSGREKSDMSEAKTGNRICFAKRAFWISKVSTAKDRRSMNVVILDILLSDLGTGTANALLPFKSKESYVGSWDIPKLYELGDEEVQKIIVKVISKKSEVLDDGDLEFLCDKLGFSMTKDYMITKDYLQAMTKEQLGDLATELKINMTTCGPKKSEAVEFIFKRAPKGKLPKELTKK